MLSHVQGGTDVPLFDRTIGQLINEAVVRWGDRIALIDRGQGVHLTWQSLSSQSDALASELLGLGLTPGDRIGIWSLNRAEWTLTQFAAAKAGLILVTINPAYRLTELEFVLAQSGLSAIVIAPTFKASDYPAMIRAALPELTANSGGAVYSARFPRLRFVIQIGEVTLPGALAFDALLASGAERDPAVLSAIGDTLLPGDAINIQYTSGTTGSPKGVTLSHRNLLNNGYFVGRGIALSRDDKLCIPVPLYHCFGLSMGNLACLTHGAAMVYPGLGFDPLATLETIAAERCTALYGVPTMFIAQLDHPRFPSFDLSSLRTGIMAGSPCPVEVMRRVADRMHMTEATICYGMTETSPVSFQSAVTDSLERRVTTVGQVHPHVEVKIIDENGDIVLRGVPGELCTRGYNVMLGYWDDPNQTLKVKDAEGWMHSGDLATIDEEGFCNIVGRLKDMVIRGGENLYPREIEEFLYRHPAIRDVQVFGVPDPHYGEELCAWIILDDKTLLTDTEIRRFCEGEISHQKIPRHILFVDAFPMTVTGKIQKFRMREAMIGILGVSSSVTA